MDLFSKVLHKQCRYFFACVAQVAAGAPYLDCVLYLKSVESDKWIYIGMGSIFLEVFGQKDQNSSNTCSRRITLFKD